MYKATIRAHFWDWIKTLSEEDHHHCSQIIVEQFFNHIILDHVETIHIFLPIQKNKEVNTWPLIRRLWEKHPHIKTITSISNFEDFSMRHFIFSSSTEIRENSKGIPEPVNGKLFTDSLDMIIVPLLGFDINGHRVGYGKGFYDRFLAHYPTAIRIGCSLVEPVDCINDVHEHDIRLHHASTPFKWYTFE
jgi:5-formyltetrahydrofolate cyclo-ligase